MMSEEDKQLLTIDLCYRLPFVCGLEVEWRGDTFNMINIGFGRVTLLKRFMSVTSGSPLIEEVKPILTPISELDPRDFEGQFEWEILPDGRVMGETKAFDYFNSHDIDYRGLIEKGLAIKKS